MNIEQLNNRAEKLASNPPARTAEATREWIREAGETTRQLQMAMRTPGPAVGDNRYITADSYLRTLEQMTQSAGLQLQAVVEEEPQAVVEGSGSEVDIPATVEAVARHTVMENAFMQPAERLALAMQDFEREVAPVLPEPSGMDPEVAEIPRNIFAQRVKDLIAMPPEKLAAELDKGVHGVGTNVDHGPKPPSPPNRLDKGNKGDTEYKDHGGAENTRTPSDGKGYPKSNKSTRDIWDHHFDKNIGKGHPDAQSKSAAAKEPQMAQQVKITSVPREVEQYGLTEAMLLNTVQDVHSVQKEGGVTYYNLEHEGMLYGFRQDHVEPVKTASSESAYDRYLRQKAAGEMPPQFRENAEKNKGKKKDDDDDDKAESKKDRDDDDDDDKKDDDRKKKSRLIRRGSLVRLNENIMVEGGYLPRGTAGIVRVASRRGLRVETRHGLVDLSPREIVAAPWNRSRGEDDRPIHNYKGDGGHGVEDPPNTEGYYPGQFRDEDWSRDLYGDDDELEHPVQEPGPGLRRQQSRRRRAVKDTSGVENLTDPTKNPPVGGDPFQDKFEEAGKKGRGNPRGPDRRRSDDVKATNRKGGRISVATARRVQASLREAGLDFDLRDIPDVIRLSMAEGRGSGKGRGGRAAAAGRGVTSSRAIGRRKMADAGRLPKPGDFIDGDSLQGTWEVLEVVDSEGARAAGFGYDIDQGDPFEEGEIDQWVIARPHQDHYAGDTHEELFYAPDTYVVSDAGNPSGYTGYNEDPDVARGYYERNPNRGYRHSGVLRDRQVLA